ncbi:iron ABC transporter permease [Elstera litoralis]|uniref:Iron ABC transporter permease n=1 Tax=Elstera litoralis TaxID=552518 RepID=A0A0F3IY84_9PROT|nr:iron chelate uptake ABC transporter family permease subunit [Elstera litoralis]KJV10549.1 iron ABC transporter permease [Elstera litoralis]
MSARPIRSGPLAAAGGLLLLGGLAGVSLFVGAADLATGEMLWISRLPRTLAALLVGAGLAIAGLVMQTLARNRFVDPTLAGTEQSAMLGILLVTLLWPQAPIALKMAVASAVALLGTGGFLAAVRRLPPTEPFLLPLFGLIYGGVIGAGVTFIAWQMDLLQYVETWVNGDFSGILRGRYELLWGAALLVALAWWFADALTIAALGKEMSLGLGLNYESLVRLGVVLVAVLSALSVSVVGMIPFIGLIVPNLVSRFCGDNLRHSLPWVALGGGALCLAADLLGRVLRQPYEIPVGTILGVLGSLAFLLLLLGKRRHGG